MMTTDIKNQAIVRIIDDDVGVRDSYRFFLEGEGWRVIAYPNAEEFLAKDNTRIAGCILLDIRMPGMSGLQLQNHLLAKESTLPIIFITAHGTIEDAVLTVKKGACDFLQKPVKDDVLLNTIENAVKQNLDQLAVDRALQDDLNLIRHLTEREAEVATELAAGKLNKQIAADLGISERTVQVHRASLLKKLGIRSTAELTALLIRTKSVRPSQEASRSVHTGSATENQSTEQ